MQSIETTRLIMRNFQAGDEAKLFEYLHAPTSSCFFDLKLENLEAARNEVSKRAGNDGSIAVCLKDTGRLIGDLFWHSDDEGREQSGAPSRADTFSVGWNFNPRFGGKGYALEASRALCNNLFGNRGARRIYAYVEDHNAPSRRLCEKLGMREEGLFLEYISFQNDSAGHPIYENTMQYAILAREWDMTTNAG